MCAEEFLIVGFGKNSYKTVRIEYPGICPICHTVIVPVPLYGHFDDQKGENFSVMFSCPHGHVFEGKYSCFDKNSALNGTLPKAIHNEKFSEYIRSISEEFVEVYNESLEAEQLGLNSICGAGYRKAIEYLVKSYCASKDPENSNAIWGEPLGATINRIDDERMRAVSFAAKEIGNDQTHTVIKLSDGIPEMKKYIRALTSYLDFINASDSAIRNYQK